MSYTEQQVAAVAKREKNTKRTYLVVNPLQGKHVPVSPGKTLAMFEALSDLLLEAYGDERLLLIGFAETATAAGAAAAGRLGSLYMQTTREELEGATYFYFSERHSHAAEQKLVREDLERAVSLAERIVFIEDEITTGDTIQNIVELLERAFPGRFCYSAASLQNGMDESHRQAYEKKGIRLHWLVKTSHEGYEERASACLEDGIYHECVRKKPEVSWEEYTVHGGRDARRLVDGKDYERACRQMGQEILERVPWKPEERVLVLGTEEFMYPSILLASLMEDKGMQVWCHATTRSPIAVSKEKSYPLHERYELASLYDQKRRTFLYDLRAYDRVYIVTDAQEREKEGLYSLINALALWGNDQISVIRWKA